MDPEAIDFHQELVLFLNDNKFTDHNNLLDSVRDFCFVHGQQFSLYSKKARDNKRFKCTFCKKCDCKAYMVINFNPQTHVSTLTEYNFNHTHTKDYVELHRTMQTKENKKILKDLKSIGASHSEIDKISMQNRTLPISSNQLQSILGQSSSNKKLTHEAFDELQQKYPNGFSIHVHWSDKNPDFFLDGSVHHTKIMKTRIIIPSQSVFFIDSTSCIIAKDNRQAIGVTVKDSNNTFQNLSFGILQNNSEAAYTLYLNDLKQQISTILNFENFYPYAFVCDRYKAQINAIKKVFPKSKIVYCKRHLMKNFDVSYSEFAPICKQFIEGEISENLFLEQVEEIYNQSIENPKYSSYQKKTIEQQYQNLHNLYQEKEHWFPSYLIKYHLYYPEYRTSNGIEAFFSGFKNYLEHKRYNIYTLFEDFIILTIKKLQKLFLAEEQLFHDDMALETNPVEKFPNISKDLFLSLGQLGRTRLFEQLQFSTTIPTFNIDEPIEDIMNLNQICPTCYTEDQSILFPCSHILSQQPSIYIPECYLKVFDSSNLENIKLYPNTNQSRSKAYSQTIKPFSQINQQFDEHVVSLMNDLPETALPSFAKLVKQSQHKTIYPSRSSLQVYPKQTPNTRIELLKQRAIQKEYSK